MMHSVRCSPHTPTQLGGRHSPGAPLLLRTPSAHHTQKTNKRFFHSIIYSQCPYSIPLCRSPLFPPSPLSPFLWVPPPPPLPSSSQGDLALTRGSRGLTNTNLGSYFFLIQLHTKHPSISDFLHHPVSQYSLLCQHNHIVPLSPQGGFACINACR